MPRRRLLNSRSSSSQRRYAILYVTQCMPAHSHAHACPCITGTAFLFLRILGSCKPRGYQCGLLRVACLMHMALWLTLFVCPEWLACCWCVNSARHAPKSTLLLAPQQSTCTNAANHGQTIHSLLAPYHCGAIGAEEEGTGGVECNVSRARC